MRLLAVTLLLLFGFASAIAAVHEYSGSMVLSISNAEQSIIISKREEGLFLFNPILKSTIKIYSYNNNDELADLKTLRQDDDSTVLLNLKNKTESYNFLCNEIKNFTETVLKIDYKNEKAKVIGQVTFSRDIKNGKYVIANADSNMITASLLEMFEWRFDPFNAKSQQRNGNRAITENGTLFFKDNKGVRIQLLTARKKFNRKSGCGGYGYPEVSPDGQKVCFIFKPKLCVWGKTSRLMEIEIAKKTSRLLAKGFFSSPKYSDNGKWLLVGENNFPEKNYWVIDLRTLEKYMVCADCHSAAWISSFRIIGENK